MIKLKFQKIFLIVLLPFIIVAGEKSPVSFPSADGLFITADLYKVHDAKNPFIILFHQAGWSRGEYKEIAPKLNEMGFNCLAVDQRSGGEVNGITNETNLKAETQKKSTTYIDAYPDLQAALSYAKKHYVKGKLIVWGSSYSAALGLKLTAENQEIVDGVLAFAPGEYFGKLGKSKTFITESVNKLNCPVFITSAKDEKPNWESIYVAIPSKNKTSFVPETEGNHGSRALWEKFNDSKYYWKAVTKFLKLFLTKK